MRLDKVYIDGFKNLKQLEVDFDETKLTTVLIGQNGAGKSNLIEALAQVFAHVDLRSAPLRFKFRVTYRIQVRKAKPGELTQVVLSNMPDEAAILIDGKSVSRAEFERNKSEWFPDFILATAQELKSGLNKCSTVTRVITTRQLRATMMKKPAIRRFWCVGFFTAVMFMG